MSLEPTFQAFPKITRYLNVEFTITEKIDGTNAAFTFDWDGTLVSIQSRKRLIFPTDDNYGFARWVTDNQTELFEFFGEGIHFGEWWGAGIQKRYRTDQKWFSPFNVSRFNHDTPNWPKGCTCVPVLATGVSFEELPRYVNEIQSQLMQFGSVVDPGRGLPSEGIMIWSQATGYIKHPFDDGHKWTRGEESK